MEICEKNETGRLQAGEQIAEWIQWPPEMASQNSSEKENWGHVHYNSHSLTVDQDISAARKSSAELYCPGNVCSWKTEKDSYIHFMKATENWQASVVW